MDLPVWAAECSGVRLSSSSASTLAPSSIRVRAILSSPGKLTIEISLSLKNLSQRCVIYLPEEAAR